MTRVNEAPLALEVGRFRPERDEGEFQKADKFLDQLKGLPTKEAVALDIAEEIQAKLRSLGEPAEATARFGDPFMLQRYYPQKTKLEISKLFGQGFTQSVFELSPGEWHGPVLSGYGVHLVYVHDHAESPAPEFAAVEERVKQDWLDDKRRERETNV